VGDDDLAFFDFDADATHGANIRRAIRSPSQECAMEESDKEIIAAFSRLPGLAWLMQFEKGWYAYRNDEPKLGPFESKVEAAQAGLKAWSK
jgi:hypothetical protein